MILLRARATLQYLYWRPRYLIGRRRGRCNHAHCIAFQESNLLDLIRTYIQLDRLTPGATVTLGVSGAVVGEGAGDS